jgi:AcrR family transcriptional regulator
VPKNTFSQISAEKRERVLGQAAKLFSEHGYTQTDMAQLAAKAGVSKGSLYTYFASKEELYLHVCRDGLERSREAIYGSLDSKADVYAQVEHIFTQDSSSAGPTPHTLCST